MTENPPYGAKITVEKKGIANGYLAKELDPHLSGLLSKASENFFGQKWRSFGSGGAIPFMSGLGSLYPHTQIIGTGVMSPDSNAHVENENLNLAFAKKLLKSITFILGGLQ